MKIIIISGLSGSGKTVALHTLEDEDYYCIDNLPLGLLSNLVDNVLNRNIRLYNNVAIGIDARSEAHDLRNFTTLIEDIRKKEIKVEVIYLQADLSTLIKRFSDTRRKHPLTKKGLPLSEAIEVERNLLGDVASSADLYLDTTYTNIHQLRELIKQQVAQRKQASLSLLFQSFGFKHGTPADSDYVFDVRCLPNPHWDTSLRPLTGLDTKVIQFLENEEDVITMKTQISDYLKQWIPQFEKQNRYYLTVSIGCTGGQHRSVYLCQTLCDEFREFTENVSVRHRELE